MPTTWNHFAHLHYMGERDKFSIWSILPSLSGMQAFEKNQWSAQQREHHYHPQFLGLCPSKRIIYFLSSWRFLGLNFSHRLLVEDTLKEAQHTRHSWQVWIPEVSLYLYWKTEKEELNSNVPLTTKKICKKQIDNIRWAVIFVHLSSLNALNN